MNKVYSIAIMIATIAMFSGCAKDGATGPQGPAGLNGVANISSSTYTAIPGVWNTITANQYYSFSVADPDITDFNNDLVEVFAQVNGGDWLALPASDFLTYNNDIMGFSYNNNSVTVYYIYTSAPTININFKYVVIPPAMKKPNVDYSNYAAVKSAYNLKD